MVWWLSNNNITTYNGGGGMGYDSKDGGDYNIWFSRTCAKERQQQW